MKNLPECPTSSYYCDIKEEIEEAFVSCDFDVARELAEKEIRALQTSETWESRKKRESVKIKLWPPLNTMDVCFDSAEVHRKSFLLSILLQCSYELRDSKSVAFCTNFCMEECCIDISSLLLWLELKRRDREDITPTVLALHSALHSFLSDRANQISTHLMLQDQEEKTNGSACGSEIQECYLEVMDLLLQRLLLPSAQYSRALAVIGDAQRLFTSGPIQERLMEFQKNVQNLSSKELPTNQQNITHSAFSESGQDELDYKYRVEDERQVECQPCWNLSTETQVAAAVGAAVIVASVVFCNKERMLCFCKKVWSFVSSSN